MVVDTGKFVSESRAWPEVSKRGLPERTTRPASSECCWIVYLVHCECAFAGRWRGEFPPHTVVEGEPRRLSPRILSEQRETLERRCLRTAEIQIIDPSGHTVDYLNSAVK